MQFEWDPAKAKANLAKHGISFERATAVFADALALIEEDDETSEERWRITGMADGVLLRVVYTEGEISGGPLIRIISARRLTQSERRRYEDEI
jgi:uncharacterized DUF497 family protein